MGIVAALLFAVLPGYGGEFKKKGAGAIAHLPPMATGFSEFLSETVAQPQ